MLVANATLGCYNEIDFRLGTVKVVEEEINLGRASIFLLAKDRQGRQITLDSWGFYKLDAKEEKRTRNKVANVVKLLNS